MLTPTARNLVRVFTLQDRLKSLGASQPPTSGSVYMSWAPASCGGDIAAWCVSAWHERYAAGSRGAIRATGTGTRIGVFRQENCLDANAAQAAAARLQMDLAGDGAARADVVIEAIFENADAKRRAVCEARAAYEAGRNSGHEHFEHSCSLAVECGPARSRPSRGPAFLQPLLPRCPWSEIIASGQTRPEVAQAGAKLCAQAGQASACLVVVHPDSW